MNQTVQQLSIYVVHTPLELLIEIDAVPTSNATEKCVVELV